MKRGELRAKIIIMAACMLSFVLMSPFHPMTAYTAGLVFACMVVVLAMIIKIAFK